MKICFVSPYEELTNIARETARDKGLDIYIVQAELKEVEPIADYVNKEGFDVIITRGATIGAIEKLTAIPVTIPKRILRETCQGVQSILTQCWMSTMKQEGIRSTVWS